MEFPESGRGGSEIASAKPHVPAGCVKALIFEVHSIPRCHVDSPSDPLALIKQIDWASLEHALGPAVDTPAALADLLNGAPEAQAGAVDHLNDPVHHQNSLYSATAPAALYVAVILSDPRTDTLVPGGEEVQWHPLRQALLDWLGSIADEVGIDAEATWLRSGFSPEESPEFTAVRVIRPALFQTVSAFFQDANPIVREAAIAAAIPLLDAPELTGHQADLAPFVRSVLATTSNRVYRHIAVRGLGAWGQETASLVDRTEYFSDEPPF
ncbi:hypothetical protein [Nonomuraea sediminis]|uniref:hypothetical protein n=1 Tax=Nonomuraea sediminis TaxID=2835864 RepID=UPI001BDDA939|nr:hypothetical protein [Nonomuraea sediminis]